MYLVEGELVAMLDGKRFRFAQGDCMIATQGRGHGFINESASLARMITMYPSVAPEMTPIDDSGVVDGRPESGVTFRSEAEAYEFFPRHCALRHGRRLRRCGIDIHVGTDIRVGRIGAQSLPPGSRGVDVLPQRRLTAVYGEENDIPISAGDNFLCETGVSTV